MPIPPARRPSRKQIIPRKVAERLRGIDDAKAARMYSTLVAPFLANLKGMANAHARGNKALADEMLADVVLKIIVAAKKKRNDDRGSAPITP